MDIVRIRLCFLLFENVSRLQIWKRLRFLFQSIKNLTTNRIVTQKSGSYEKYNHKAQKSVDCI